MSVQSEITRINSEVSEQTVLISQILDALASRTTGVSTDYTGAETPLSSNTIRLRRVLTAINGLPSDDALADLARVTVAPWNLAEGETAMNSSGEIIVGTAKFRSTAILGAAKLGTIVLGDD